MAIVTFEVSLFLTGLTQTDPVWGAMPSRRKEFKAVRGHFKCH
jgi:hypothetical protein